MTLQMIFSLKFTLRFAHAANDWSHAPKAVLYGFSIYL